jgi:predicted phosphodiesterase
MKIGAIGDIHGRTIWEEFIKNDEIDLWVFVGDYFDTFDVKNTGNKQIDNFNKILNFKKNTTKDVIILTGNHDYHYIKSVDARYSGYQHMYQNDIREVVEKSINDNLMQLCYLNGDYFFSHAGLTKTWCQDTLRIKKPKIDENLVTQLNELLKYKPRKFAFKAGMHYNPYGDEITQGPLWVRPNSLLKDKIDDMNYIIGHTNTQQITMVAKDVINIDCLDYSNSYLIIDDGILEFKTI